MPSQFSLFHDLCACPCTLVAFKDKSYMCFISIPNSWLSIKVLTKCELIYKPQSPLPIIRSSRHTSRHSLLPQRQSCSENRYLGSCPRSTGTQTQPWWYRAGNQGLTFKVLPGSGLCRSVDLSASLLMGSFFVSLSLCLCLFHCPLFLCFGACFSPDSLPFLTAPPCASMTF